MNNTSPTYSRSIRHGLLLTGASIVTLLAATTAQAQDAAPIAQTPAEQAAQSAEVEQDVVVTGSRIRSPTLTSPSPIQVVTAQDIENKGAIDIQEVLQQNPAFGPPGASRTTSTFGTGPGRATVDLRGLGASRTLVLIDGRRTVAGSPGSSIVDLAMIPSSFVERVDVLTGGASAVYGSDAIAGVVNFIYKKNFEGFRASIQSGISERGDDDNYSANATFGRNFANGDGNMMVYVGWQREGAILNTAREFSAFDYTSLGTTQRVGTPSAANLVAAQNLFVPLYAPSNVGPGGVFSIAGAGNRIINPDGSVRAYDATRDGFNRAAFGAIASPVERLTFAVRTNYDVSDSVNVFFEGTYNRVDTKGYLEASPLRTDGALGAFNAPGNANGYFNIEHRVFGPGGVTTIVRNPFVSDAVYNAANDRTGDGLKDVSFLLRTTMFGDGTRAVTTQRDNFRIALGTDVDLGGGWNLDAYYSYGSTRSDTTMTGLANLYNVANAVQVVSDIYDVNRNGSTTDAICLDANARANGCVPFNPFGLNANGTSKISQEAINYVKASYQAHAFQDMHAAALNLSGTLFQLPGGPVQLAAGLEYREEASRDTFDPLTNQARNGYTQATDTVGSFSVKEAYAEVVVPLLTNQPFFHNLTLRGAARVSDYSTVGTFYAYNGGVEWSPVPDIRFRGVYAHAVRAPNIGELFEAPQQGIISITDPCQGVTLASTSATAVNCRAAPGVLTNIQANGSFTLTVPDQQGVGSLTASNPNIQEETATTYTAGVVINPVSIDALRGLTFTADYFNIKLKDAISRISQATVLNKCYVQGVDEFCQFVTRRSTANGAFSAGSVEQVVRALVNSGGSKTEGLDFTLSYTMETFGGRANFQTSWTHLLAKGNTPLAGDPYDNSMGELGTPKDAASASISWDNDTVGFTVSGEYIGKTYLDYENFQTRYVLADGSLPDKELFAIDSIIYTDAQVRFKVMDTMQFFVGVKNLFDVERPPLYTGVAGNVNGSFDPIGRRFYAGARLKF
ncbi:TonB-dependent receptor domain-containing protein [Sphingomonas sp. LT1P40]|uniref:TonB-dependent receptor domain-containing protein n=1 Tax=Alteristakelama amylovorans TaxID=3096166 RepID=UPI002FC80379